MVEEPAQPLGGKWYKRSEVAVNTYAPSRCGSSDHSRVDNSFAVLLAIAKVILEHVFRVFEFLLLSYRLR